MKFIRNVFIGILLLYTLFWLCLAVYFSLVDRNKESFETQLSRYFSRPVTIGALETSWQGLSPVIDISGFRVAGEGDIEPPLSFELLHAKLDPWSVLKFWPKFSEFSVQQPVLEVASLNADQISVAGIILSFEGSSSPIRPKTVVRWLLDQYRTQWSDGKIIWRRQNGEHIEYSDISFVFDRKQQNRSIVAGFTGVDGAVNFKAQSQGDLLSEKGWNASLEILGGDGRAFVAHDDFSLLVEDGKGSLKLKQLQVQTIQDFIALSGLTKKVSWLSQSSVLGYLHDMTLDFSGSLFAVKDWEMAAQASNVGFQSENDGPKINNLAGRVTASEHGGQFLFSTQGAVFEWLDKFESPFEIKLASGDFSWKVTPQGDVDVSLVQGQVDDGHTRLSNVNMSSTLNRNVRNVNNLGDLFTVSSVSELDFEDDKIVKPKDENVAPWSIDASAEFEMDNADDFDRYLPKIKNLKLFGEWSRNAFNKGLLSNGRVSYQGELSKQALHTGRAFFNLSYDFSDIEIDYGHPRPWPILDRGNGKLKIVNDLLIITSNDAYIGGDKVRDFSLQLPNLFDKNLELSASGKVTKSLKKVADFIFSGPLIAEKNRLKVHPVRADAGLVDIDLSLKMPLTKISGTQVKGSAVIRDAVVYLPGEVPISVAKANINFTESSVSSKQVKANFLGGELIADIVTVKQAQPPVFKVQAEGIAALGNLKPWLGGHVLSLMDGVTPWQGSLLVDGSNLLVETSSGLNGVTINAPSPIGKLSNETRSMSLAMEFGSRSALSLEYDNVMSVDMLAKQANGSLFDQALIRVANDATQFQQLRGSELAGGVNLTISRDDINIDDWIAAIIELADYESVNSVGGSTADTDSPFVESMRSIKIDANNPVVLGREIGVIDLSLTSVDGFLWGGNIQGANVVGAMALNFPDNDYQFNLSQLMLGAPLPVSGGLPSIDYSLSSSSYPSISVTVDDFEVSDKKFGRLELLGAPDGDAWVLSKFGMQKGGVETVAQGRWLNSKKLGSITSFDFETKISQADTALDDFSLDGFIKRGNGSVTGNLNWIGAPHEFEYSRLNGDFDLQLVDGELLKVEPGGGKVLGLLNFNAAARRLTLDFRDVFADGLTFDRMQYKGLFSDGKAIMRDAYLFTPAVFVRMEGQVDVANEMIDMEIHMSPELGGNLALLSALANPAAGAVVFLTQRIFKNQIRDVNFTSYRALGSWEEFEIVPFSEGEVSDATAEEAASKLLEVSEDVENKDKELKNTN